MALYLHCAICSRKQAEGLLSGAAWGRVELPEGTAIDHPSIRGSTARACPSCCTDPIWQEQVLHTLGLGSGLELRPAQ